MSQVVVTGLGAITALGNSVEEFQKGLMQGTDGIAPISQFQSEKVRTRIAAEVKDFNPENHFDKPQLDYLDRFAQFALVASREAVADAGLRFTKKLAQRTAVVHGTGIGGQNTQEASYHSIYACSAKRVHPFTIPKIMPNAGCSHISIEFGITGPSFTTATACSSAGHAIGLAYMMLRQGMVDVALSGGGEACITPGTMMGWDSLRVTSNDTCRPFSKNRSGTVIGEGAATLVLETLEHALSRGAKIYAEIIGFGMSADAYNIVQPLQAGAERALRMCMEDAGLMCSDIQYINAHGTATRQNDITETRAIRAVFGEEAPRLSVSSTKSMHGHTLGAAAALESLAVITALQRQKVPATMNFTAVDPECDLDYVPNEARALSIENALCNSFAFGGLNTVLGFRRYQR